MGAIKTPDSIIGYKFDTVRTATGNVEYTDIDLVACNPASANITLTLNNSASANMVSGRVFTIINESPLYSVVLVAKDGQIVDIIAPETGSIVKTNTDNPLLYTNWKVMRTDGSRFNTSKYLDSDLYTRAAAVGGLGLSTSGLYIWRGNTSSAAFTPVFGSTNLSLTGTLTAQTDHLGNTTYCGQNSTYQTYTAAGIVGTGSFSLQCRVKRASWAAPVSEEYIVSNAVNLTTNGDWSLSFRTDGYLKFGIRAGGATTYLVAFDCSTLDPTIYHTFELIWSSGNQAVLYVDGLLLRSEATALTLAADAQKFQISGYNGNNNLWTGNISEVTLHSGTAWTTEQTKKIYARGSRQFATVKQDGELDINLPLEGKWFNYTTTITPASGSFDNLSNTSSFCVDKDKVTFLLQFYIDSWTTPSSYFTLYPPIIAVSSFSGAGGNYDTNYIAKSKGLSVVPTASSSIFINTSDGATFTGAVDPNYISVTIVYRWK
jgi:hypothetical protein